MADQAIQVVIGVLVEHRGDGPYVLIAQRPRQAVLGGLWELPGGKLEPGEAPRDGLAREFAEELGIAVHVGEELPILEHTYDHGHVRLQPFYCRLLRGPVRNLAVTQHRWVRPTELSDYTFPPANAPLLDQVCRDLNGSGS